MIPWTEKLQQNFMLMFNRPVDVVSLAYYSIKTRGMSIIKANRYISNDLEEYKKKVRDGEDYIREKTIIIAGLIQNAASNISAIRERCARMVAGFRDYRILIVENNSIDDTRNLLLQWAQDDDKVIILCNDPFIVNSVECDLQHMFPLNETHELHHSPLPRRIHRMAFLRNVYMTHIRQYLSNFDFLCIMDLDLEGSLFIDGFHHSFHLFRTNQKIDAIAGNGMIRIGDDDFFYYDSFAYVEEHEPIMWNDSSSKSDHDSYVHMHATHLLSSQMIPIRVRSAFGGISLYRLSKIIDHTYSYSSTHYSCEHTFFHDNINIWINPRFIFLIDRNV